MSGYKISRYNVAKSVGGETWVYNTLCSGFAKMPTDQWRLITEKTRDGKTIETNEADENLVTAGVLVEDGMDELQCYKYLCYSKMFQNDYLYLTIAPTMKCNFGCFYCFEEGHKNAGAMSQDVEDKIVGLITHNKRKEILITWFGGEPLLAFDRIVSICGKLKQNKVGFASQLITNGSLLTPAVVEKLPMLNLDCIQTSLDGLVEDHDRRCVFKNGSPSFGLIMRNIDHLLNNTSIKVSVKVTVDRSNPTAFDDVRKFLLDRYPNHVSDKRISVSPAIVRDRTGFDTKGCCYDANAMLEEYVKSFENKSKVCLQPALPGMSMPCMFRCKSSFAIDSQGYIYRCLEHLGVPETKVGDLNTGNLSITSMSKTAFLCNPFEDAECLACSFLPVCGGGCPIDRAKRKGNGKAGVCTALRSNLAELLPYFYTYQYKTC